MSINLKIFLGIAYLLILFSFLYLIFKGIQINRLDDFTYYKELQTEISAIITSNIIINLFYFFIFSLIWIALLGFGLPILIISGIFFGQWLGTVASLISISIGTLVLYSIGNFFFRDVVKKVLEKKFKKYILLFQKNEFYYFFIYRLVGGLGSSFWFTKFNSNFIWDEENELFSRKFFRIYSKLFYL